MFTGFLLRKTKELSEWLVRSYLSLFCTFTVTVTYLLALRLTEKTSFGDSALGDVFFYSYLFLTVFSVGNTLMVTIYRDSNVILGYSYDVRLVFLALVDLVSFSVWSVRHPLLWSEWVAVLGVNHYLFAVCCGLVWYSLDYSCLAFFLRRLRTNDYESLDLLESIDFTEREPRPDEVLFSEDNFLAHYTSHYPNLVENFRLLKEQYKRDCSKPHQTIRVSHNKSLTIDYHAFSYILKSTV